MNPSIIDLEIELALVIGQSRWSGITWNIIQFDEASLIDDAG